MASVLTYAEVISALKAKYQPPEWAMLFEVRNQTGFSSHVVRTADAVAVNLYPSKGNIIHGFEVKATRGDLMNDLRNPEKHMEIAKNCHFWWLVVTDASIIKDGELPESWGLMVPRGKSLIIKKQAQLREHNGLPITFVTSLLRSALQVSPSRVVIDAEVKREVEKATARCKHEYSYDADRYKRAHESLKESVEDFEKASGVLIRAYNGGKIGDAVDFVIKGGFTGLADKFRRMGEDASVIKDLCDQGVELATEEVKEIEE